MAIGDFLGLKSFLNPILVSLLASTVSNFLDDQLVISVAEFPTYSDEVCLIDSISYISDRQSVNQS